jgi:hypothetical protein
MIASLAYYLILGKPLIFYTGILTYLSFSFTALLGYTHYIGRPLLPFKWHPIFAVTSLILGAIHGLFGLSVYLRF